MKKYTHALVAFVSAVVITAPVQAKKKTPAETPPAEQQQSGGPEQPSAPPSYQPFPHYRNFVLTEINGKPSPVEIWINIDATGHARGFSGCKNWSAVFVIGPDRLGPKSMPAVNEQKCDPALAAIERDFWNIMISGPYWESKGDDLIFKGAKGGLMRFQRTL